MEEQLHRHTAGTNVHEEDQHGGHQLKDEAHSINNSSVVRSGLIQPTVMGTPVLAEDLYAPSRSDIVDPPKRSVSQWEEEERHGDPPPLSTGAYGTRPEDLSQFGHHHVGIDKDPYNPTATADPITGYATYFNATAVVTAPYDSTTVPVTGYATPFDEPNPQPSTNYSSNLP